MALTRSMLKGMGLTEEQIGAIIDAHSETVEGLKADRDKFKTQAETAGNKLKDYEDLSKDDWKGRYEQEHKDYEAYKKTVADKEKLESVKAAYRDLLVAQNVGEKHIDTVLRFTDFSKMKLVDGKLEGEDKLIETIKADCAGFITTESVKGAEVTTPPATGTTKLTKADIYKRDEHGRYVMSTAERQKALAENPDLMR